MDEVQWWDYETPGFNFQVPTGITYTDSHASSRVTPSPTSSSTNGNSEVKNPSSVLEVALLSIFGTIVAIFFVCQITIYVKYCRSRHRFWNLKSGRLCGVDLLQTKCDRPNWLELRRNHVTSKNQIRHCSLKSFCIPVRIKNRNEACPLPAYNGVSSDSDTSRGGGAPSAAVAPATKLPGQVIRSASVFTLDSSASCPPHASHLTTSLSRHSPCSLVDTFRSFVSDEEVSSDSYIPASRRKCLNPCYESDHTSSSHGEVSDHTQPSGSTPEGKGLNLRGKQATQDVGKESDSTLTSISTLSSKSHLHHTRDIAMD